MFLNLLRHSGFSPLCLGKSCGFSGWALTPFAVCFAVFWMVRRKSGWGICVLPCVFLVCFLVVVICLVACDHLRPCNSFLTYSFFSCKDRALERDRPYQRGKKNAWLGKSHEWAQASPAVVVSRIAAGGVFHERSRHL